MEDTAATPSAPDSNYENRVAAANQAEASSPYRESQNPATADYGQWVVGPNSTFRPTGRTVGKVPPGVYKVCADNHGVFIEKSKVVTDDLVVLPGSVGERLLPKMQKFWDSKHKYIERGLLYKKGAIFYGPPGGGKTSDLQLLIKQLVDIGGIVVICAHPTLLTDGLKIIRTVEPDRNIICVFEDIDETIARYGDSDLLSLLDGEAQISNVFNVATTNYIDRLEARIANRPGRFDIREFVPMPTAAARKIYLQKIAPELDEYELTCWVKDTENFSAAHLRELASSVFCLEEAYLETLNRLKAMRERPKDSADGYKKGTGSTAGFNLQQLKTAAGQESQQSGILR